MPYHMAFKLGKYALDAGHLQIASVSGGTTFKNSDKEGIDMEFLKEILGEELYAQVEAKVNEHNGNEANKDKLIKLANLETGEYVGKGKYESLETLLKGKETELNSANDLIKQLRKGTEGNEVLQNKISDYETTVQNLQSELKENKIKSAIKIALMSEKVVDVGYLTYKLDETMKEKGETLELDENENIKGWKEIVERLKVQCPNMFSTGEGDRIIDPNKLKEPDNRNVIPTKEQFRSMGYEERVKLKQNNEQVYRQLAKN